MGNYQKKQVYQKKQPQEMFYKNVKNSAKFTEKQLCQSLFFNIVAGQLFLRTPLDDSFFTNACNSKIYISNSTFSKQMQ